MLFRDLDAKFEAFLDSVQISITRKDLTPEKRKERRARADTSDLDFCKIYFPQIFDLPWNEMHRSIARLKYGKHTRSGFRKGGKTAFGFIAKAIKPLMLNIGGIINVDLRTQALAEERTAALIRIIKKNRLLLYDYNPEIFQDKKGYYIVGSTILLGTSVEVGVRSYVDESFKRFRIALIDDTYNRQSVKSDKDNQKVVDHVNEIDGMLEDDGLRIFFGNNIAVNCPLNVIKGWNPDNHFSLPALNTKGESTWPEYRTADEWDQFRKTIPLDVWEGDYMDKPFERGDIFDRDWLRSINVNTVHILASLSAADPAHGTSPTACMKSIATVGVTNKQEVILQDMYLRHEDYFGFFDYIDALIPRVPRWKVLLFENDFGQWGFAHPYYVQWVEKRRKTISIYTHYSKNLKTEFRGADKESRILNLVHPHQTGMFLYAEVLGNLLKGMPATRDMERYVQQYLAFGKIKDKLDGLDAVATAYIMIFRYIETGSFKPLGKKAFPRTRLFKGKRWLS